MDKPGDIRVVEERPRRKRGRKIAAVSLVLLAAAVVVLTALLIHSYRDKSALADSLTESERLLELQRQTAAALEAQQNEQKTQIQKLQEDIQNLLNIEEPDPVVTSDQLREQLGSIKELVTKEYIYTNAALREGNKTWLWGWTVPFSDTSLLVTYDGVIKAGIDLAKVEIDVNEETRTVTVTLPASEVTDNNIPQENINVLEVKNNLFNSVTFDDYNTFISEEKKAMQDKAAGMGILEDADSEAKAIIRAFLNVLPEMESYTLVFK